MSKKEKGKSSRIKRALYLTLGLIAIYVLGTAPATKYCPKVAEIIYSPMSPVVQSKALHPAFKAWFSVWGVDVDSSGAMTTAAK